ncbi:MAG: TonB-dependent receptor [Bacteroidota bacterium]|nr:TonB-dependent receptor [Bacteroidota bacterium]MDP4195765.1 TonB-dependent receptor [Bacteroidota bacterium]
MKYLIIILITVSLKSSFAQNGIIYGTVTDYQGNPLVGANIILGNTGFGASTNEKGIYQIVSIPNGTYEISVSMIGYKKLVRSDVRINDNPVKVDFKLEEMSIQSKQVVVTASKYEQQITELPVSASVINSNELSERNVSSLDYALRYAPGIMMNLDQVSIRGSSGYSRGAGTRVLVAIDGIPIYSGDTGEIIWEIIPVTEIDRVEIIKGAASSLYGSTAIGGVINVITRNISNKAFTYLRGSYGIYDKPSYSVWDWSGQRRPFNIFTLTHTNKIGRFGFTLSFSRNENSGYRQDDYFKRFLGYIKANFDFTDNSSLTFLANSMNQTRGNFVYWKDSQHVLQPRDADQGQRVISGRYMFGLIYRNKFNSALSYNLRTSYYYTGWRDETSSKDTSKAGLLRGELQVNYKSNDNLLLISGIETSFGKVRSNLFSNPKSFASGIYLQGEYKFNFPLTLTLGGRYDYSKRETLNGESSVSPKFGINYKLTSSTIIRASAGRGFRAPTLAETFTSTTAAGIKIKSNPALKAESNLSLEAGINQSFGNLFNLDLAMFQNEYYDFIEPEVDTKDGQVFFGNVTRARIQGIETGLNISLIPEVLTFHSDYTYLWARDIEKHEPLKYRPRHLLYSGLSYTISPLELGLDFRTWSKIERLDNELVDLGLVKDGDKRVAVYVLDINASYSLIDLGLPGRIIANINNALNYNYIEIIGNLSPIRNYSVSLEFTF